MGGSPRPLVLRISVVLAMELGGAGAHREGSGHGAGAGQALSVTDGAAFTSANRQSFLADALANFSAVGGLQSDDGHDAEMERQRIFGEYRSKIEECERGTAHVEEGGSTLTSAQALRDCVHQ